MFCVKIKQVHFNKNALMCSLCSEITVVTINDVSVKDTNKKSDILALRQKIVFNPALLEDILFWDLRSDIYFYRRHVSAVFAMVT